MGRTRYLGISGCERVEAFANEVRTKILGIGPRENIEELRGYWTSLQPASLTDSTKKKFSPKTELLNIKVQKRSIMPEAVQRQILYWVTHF